MSTYRLYAMKGWGSVIAEAGFAVAGIPLEIVPTDIEKDEDRERLRAVNPLAQFPTLVMPDGRVMTESAAIMLHLADLRPEAGLAPPADAPERAEFQRWLVFLVAAVYPTFAYGDNPLRWVTDAGAQAELTRRNIEHRCALYSMLEGQVAPKPWFLGTRFSALDLYICAMSHWRPGRAWFKENCPKLHGIALAADVHPAVRSVWRRNFD
jgi:GST-like protein